MTKYVIRYKRNSHIITKPHLYDTWTEAEFDRLGVQGESWIDAINEADSGNPK